MTRLRWPQGPGRVAAMAALIAWSGAVAPFWLGRFSLAAVIPAILMATRRRVLAALLLMAALASGWFATERVTATLETAPAEGPVTIRARVLTDPTPLRDQVQFLVRPAGEVDHATERIWDGPPLLLIGEPSLEVAVGDELTIEGRIAADPGFLRGDPYGGTLRASRVALNSHSRQPLLAAGNALRGRIQDGLGEHGDRPGAALLAGFLIGDTTGMERADLDALRRAGLTHFVAVSGGNVALFLAAWWLVMAPLRLSTRIRGIVGLVGLAVFVVATRWEPSVLRAATMASIVLAGTTVGYPVDAWTALGSAVVVLLLVSGDLAVDVGFQLSVVATVGILSGASMFRGRRPRPVFTVLGATIAAQTAVFPLLLIHFGTVPLLAPLANLLAAPLVALATGLGGIGLLAGVEPVVRLALVPADLVLLIARTARTWPELGPAESIGLAVLGTGLTRRSLRLPAVAVAGIAAAVLLAPAGPPVDPTLVVLDVGQGDAILVRSPDGATALVDGGRDPTVLAAALRRHGVSRIDLVVATHGDIDHVGGFSSGLFAFGPSGLWVPDQPDRGETLSEIVAEASRRGVEVTAPPPGTRFALGAFTLDVVGPLRRYASDNDGSIVLQLAAGGATAMLPGDIEAVAQKELPPLRPDVLVVPHHGSATTDLEWLRATVGSVAVVSVGDNPFGHPAPEVMDVLLESGTEVHVTRQEGDVVVRLGV